MSHSRHTCAQVALHRLCFLTCLLTVTLVAADELQGDDNQNNEKWLEPARSRLMHVIGAMPLDRKSVV